MPLVRLEVKNEYGLGDPVLYRAKNDCDPKAILDGVAVAGLVGILRQLGDLAELASDIFHDLHEQVMATSARGRRLSTRMQHLETELPTFENAIRSQRSHIHFAYVAGSNWHADVKHERSHILSSDLPRLMMDSYEECRGPPRLYLLDRFDSAGTGACLKRYSDPSYFKRVQAMSELEKAENIQREKKAQKIKRKGSQIKNAGQEDASLSRRFSSARFAYPSADEQRFPNEATPISATKLKPEIESRSSSFGSRTGVNCVEQVHDTNSLGTQDELEDDRLSVSNLQFNQRGSFASDVHDKKNGTTYSSSSQSSLKEESADRSPSVTWDEKTEILKPTSPISCNNILVDDTQYSKPQPTSSEKSSDMEPETSTIVTLNQGNVTSGTNNVPMQLPSINYFDEMTGEIDNYMDALNTLESETETDSECQTKCELNSFSNSSYPQERSGTSPMQEMASLSCGLSSDDAPSGSQSFSNEDESPNTYNFMPSQQMEPVKPSYGIGPVINPEYSVGNQISNGDPFDMSKMCRSEHDHQAHEYGISQLQELASPSFDSNGDDTHASQSSINEEECKNTRNLMASKNLETVKLPHSTGSIPDPSTGNQSSEGNSSDKSRISSFEGATHQPPELSLCNSMTVSGPNTTADLSKPPSSPPVNIANVPSPKLWTNGSLLGLEPSKPPVFGNSNISNKDLVTNSNNSGYDHSSVLGETKLHGNGFAIGPAKVPSPNGIVSRNSNITKKTDGSPNASLNESSLSNGQQFSRNDNVISEIDPSLNRCRVPIRSGSGLPNSTSVESQPNESAQSTMDVTSSISALAQRFLSSSLQRKQSIVHAQNADVNPDVSKQEDTSLINNRKEGPTGAKSVACHPDSINIYASTKNSVLLSSHLCGHSSPPLEHMKISCHPMNGLETSRLKLEYAIDNFHEGTEDLSFPSFQLLPGPNLSFENNGSETDEDDDTFCRSCPYTLEDHFSPRSDSNSELWEQENISGENNHSMYNDSRRISLSSSSVSSFKGFSQLSHNDPVTGFENLEAENSILYFQNGNSRGPHGIDSLVSTNGEGMCHSPSIDPEIFVSQSQNNLPPPPPLPPMQWRMMMASIDKEGKGCSVADIVEHFNVLQVQRSTAHKQQEQHIRKPSPFPETLGSPIQKQESPSGKIGINNADNGKGFDAKEQLLSQFTKIHNGQKLDGHKETRHNDVSSKQLDESEELLHQIRNKQDSQKLNGQEEPKIPFTNQEVREREELLHQIKNKTFNLRRTSTAKANLVPQPTTNVNVAAILEKANAIRQAFVDSDDGGDDDNWSDG